MKTHLIVRHTGEGKGYVADLVASDLLIFLSVDYQYLIVLIPPGGNLMTLIVDFHNGNVRRSLIMGKMSCVPFGSRGSFHSESFPLSFAWNSSSTTPLSPPENQTSHTTLLHNTISHPGSVRSIFLGLLAATKASFSALKLSTTSSSAKASAISSF